MITRILVAFICWVSIGGCITYHRADPLTGVDFARPEERHRTDVSVQRYQANEYFSEEGEIPHHTKEPRQEQEYTRTDILFSTTTHFPHAPDLVLAIPVSFIQQDAPDPQNAEEGVWGIEQIWLGANVIHSRNHQFNVLVALGIPMAGTLGKLASPAQNHNKSARLFIQPIWSNGLAPGQFGHYLRIGAGFHFDPGIQNVSTVFEFPLELRLTVPLGKQLLAGVYSDALFTIVDYSGSRVAESHDAMAIGPCVSYDLNSQIRFHAMYRTEILGYKTSAGNSWGIGITKSVPW